MCTCKETYSTTLQPINLPTVPIAAFQSPSLHCRALDLAISVHNCQGLSNKLPALLVFMADDWDKVTVIRKSKPSSKDLKSAAVINKAMASGQVEIIKKGKCMR